MRFGKIIAGLAAASALCAATVAQATAFAPVAASIAPSAGAVSASADVKGGDNFALPFLSVIEIVVGTFSFATAIVEIVHVHDLNNKIDKLCKAQTCS